MMNVEAQLTNYGPETGSGHKGRNLGPEYHRALSRCSRLKEDTVVYCTGYKWAKTLGPHSKVTGPLHAP